MKPGRFAAALLLLAIPALAQGPVGASPLAADIGRRAAAIEQEMLAWRRHLHQHPELSNREQKTAASVAERLHSFLFLGITPPDQVGRAPANHSPQFTVDESALLTGVRALAHLAADYLSAGH